LATLCLVLTWAQPAPASQDPVLRLEPGQGSRALAPHLEILPDPGRALAIGEVSSPPQAGRFRPLERATLHLGPSPYPRWLRFTLAAGEAGEAGAWHLALRGPTGPVRCALYAPLGTGLDGRAGVHRRGDWLIQEIGWPGGGSGGQGLGRRTLPLAPPARPHTYYLSLQVAHAQYLPLELIPGRVLVPDMRTHLLLLGLVLGVLAGLAAYNLSVFFLLRDTAYLYYLFTISGLAVINVSVIGGFSQEWLPGLPLTTVPRLNHLVVLGANLAHTLFILRFFRLRQRGVFLHRPVVGLLCLQVALLPVYALLTLSPLGWVTAGLTAVRQALFWVVIIHSLAHRVAGAGFYLAGYAMLTASVWGFWLSYFGVLPYHTAIIYSLPLGTICEALFFTLALHQRVDMLRRQREEARERHIELLVRLQEQEEQLQGYARRLQQALAVADREEEPGAPPAGGARAALAELEESRDHLARQARRLEADLRHKSEALSQANAALQVLFARLEEEKAGVEERVAHTVRSLVAPALDRLKQTRLSTSQAERLQVLETAVEELVGRSVTTLGAAWAELSPAEAQVALLIRDGKATKEIAGLLGLSEHTVAAHRRSIRSKLGLAGRPVNLAAHLRGLA
jgi:DNA-binding CsgD family transcriptional regulator